jgi:hypothetical protein
MSQCMPREARAETIRSAEYFSRFPYVLTLLKPVLKTCLLNSENATDT